MTRENLFRPDGFLEGRVGTLEIDLWQPLRTQLSGTLDWDFWEIFSTVNSFPNKGLNLGLCFIFKNVSELLKEILEVFMKNLTRSDWYFTLSALITFYLLFIPGLFFSQRAEIHPPEWTTDTRENSNTTVTYSISKQDNYRGEKVTIVEYMSTNTANTTLTDCMDLLTEVSQQREFTYNSTSETIRAVSPNSWIFRYFTEAPWPMNDFDCVATMVFTDDTNEKTVLFRLIASPDEYQIMDMQRAEIYETTYTFNELDSDTGSITISIKMSPPINVPQWMIKMGIVDSAAGTIQRLATLLEKKQ